MKRQWFYRIVAIALFLLSPLFTNTSARAAVVINELLPKTDPTTDEWVELYNTGAESVSLDRWHIDHIAGDAKSYILNAGAVIQPRGFLTFSSTQTAISFSIEGDTVRLFDANGTLADSQSYPGILGYNTTMGRSTDGGDGWVICAPAPYAATPNGPNNCPPAPTPTPTAGVTPYPTATAVPTPLPTDTPIPALTPTPTPAPSTPAQMTFGSFLPSPAQTQVLGAQNALSPTPTPDQTTLTLKMDKILAYQVLTVAVLWVVIAAVAYLRRK